MGELSAVVERLRLVKSAHHRFLGLWALDCLLEGAAERFCRDLVTVAADGDLAADDAAMDGEEGSG
jgi:hypothetical protein